MICKYHISSTRHRGYYLFHLWFCLATIRGQRLFLWKAHRHLQQLNKVHMGNTVTTVSHCWNCSPIKVAHRTKKMVMKKYSYLHGLSMQVEPLCILIWQHQLSQVSIASIDMNYFSQSWIKLALSVRKIAGICEHGAWLFIIVSTLRSIRSVFEEVWLLIPQLLAFARSG